MVVKSVRAFAAASAIMMSSRVAGIAREAIILLSFGFGYNTDLFYFTTFPLVAIFALSSGPVTTAFSARLNQVGEQDRKAHVRFYANRTNKISLLAVSAYILAAAGAALLGKYEMSLVLVLLSPAAAAISQTGFYYAVATAAGNVVAAAAVMLIANGLFVVAVGAVWLSGQQIQAWTLPLCYSAAAILAFAGARILARDWLRASAQGDRTLAAPLPGFASSLRLAGTESAAFLLVQVLIMSLAATLGAGWASAASLAQRVSLSVLGILVAPAATLLMLSVMRSPQNAYATFRRGILSTFAGLFLASGFIIIVAFEVPNYIDTLYASQSFAKVVFLVPVYAFWLVPLGASYVLCRTMFGLRLDHVYTGITVASYFLASAARIACTLAGDFRMGLAAGAAFELVAVILLSAVTLKKLRLGRDSA
jgi:hypothetical protein